MAFWVNCVLYGERFLVALFSLRYSFTSSVTNFHGILHRVRGSSAAIQKEKKEMSTYPEWALADLLRLESRMWVHSVRERACLVILLLGLRRSRSTGGCASCALCTETRLVGRRGPIAPRHGGPVARMTTLVLRVVVLVMVRRRCIHTALQAKQRAAIQWKEKKTKSIRDGGRGTAGMVTIRLCKN